MAVGEAATITTSQVEIYHGRVNIRRIITDLLKQSRNEIRFVTTNPAIAADGFWDNVPENLRIQLLIGVPQTDESIGKNAPANVEVRYAENLKLNLVIGDRSKTIVIDLDAKNEPQRAILIAHTEVVSMISSIVDLFWDTANAAPTRDRIQTSDSRAFKLIRNPMLSHVIKNGIDNSKRTILWSSWNEQRIMKFRRELMAAVQRNVAVRIVTRSTPKVDSLTRLPNLSVRTVEEKVPSMLVFDDDVILLSETDRESIQGLFTNQQGFSAAIGFWFMSLEY